MRQTGAKRLERLARDQPALIVLDLNMPLMDGLTAARRIREPERQQIPIIFVTGHGTMGIELYSDLATPEGGQTEYLPRPIDLPLLEDLMQRLTRKPGEARK